MLEDPSHINRSIFNHRHSIRFFLAVVLFIGVLLPSSGNAQSSRWWVFLDEKNDVHCALDATSPDCLRADLNAASLQEIANTGALINSQSRWLNAVSISATSQQIEAIRNLGGFRQMRPVASMKTTAKMEAISSHFPVMVSVQSSDALFAMHHIDGVRAKGLTGSGVIVGMLDAGFDVNHPAFEQLRNEGRILAERDFVHGGNDTKINVTNASYHSHGTSSASIVAGSYGGLRGIAPGVSLVLARTENDLIESAVEEDYWVEALEWFETLGVHIASSSLGYNTFDDEPTSYSYDDMDGRTTVVARAAGIAARVFNMIVVTSAGNEDGSSSEAWRYIITPADADSIISVGAVNIRGRKTGFSSIGPTADGRIKPDVSALGEAVYAARSITANGMGFVNGTSFAAPAVTGMMALALEAKPGMPAYWYIQKAREASSQFETPDNQIGYGVLNAEKLIDLVTAAPVSLNEYPLDIPESFMVQNYPNPFNPATTIRYEAPAGWQLTRLDIFDMLGRHIYNHAVSGSNSGTVTWDASNHSSSGIYYARLTFSGGHGVSHAFHPMSLIK